jgi:ADP-ribose pyrophosphatase
VSSGADSHLVEAPLASRVLARGHFLEVRIDDVRLPSGDTATREYIHHPGAVAVMALLDDGALLLERQYRHPVRRVILEIPAGKIDAGEDLLACARRELLEETGYAAREWARAGSLHVAVGCSDEIIHLFFARGLVRGAQQLDDGEFIELATLTEAELDRLAARGEVTDAKTLFGLQWLQRWRGGAWPLQWFSDPGGA